MLAAVALGACSLQAQALSSVFEGTISTTDEVVLLDLTLPEATTELWLWTDSFDNGANFDPMVGIWRAFGSDWQLIDFNDDRANLAPRRRISTRGSWSTNWLPAPTSSASRASRTFRSDRC
ncbi:hypothetical protein RGE_35680 [Rubrivivax gelatinosus IL144]|uniref:Uncharacterized protein n=1 Tax=Rubrivivax gelatinosus (strain NBRC 100245 / IL144) TaxID=983917 RepID=I0HV70_RUBGI|nr:hypothetical protein RGE_35680 [Rubrivivax gelatinosus IL144]